jgi:hypothetical protein
LARFKALQCRESGSWLHEIPSPDIGTLLDNTSLAVWVLGEPITSNNNKRFIQQQYQ